MNSQHHLVSWLLRIGLAFVFLYAAISSFVNPDAWIGFFPAFLVSIVPAGFLLGGFSVYEIVLALWLLSGRWLMYAGYLAAATFAGIVLTNPGVLDLTFRDVGLFFAALALALLSRE